MSGVTVATMIASISWGSMPPRANAIFAASAARSLVATPLSTTWRSRIPVRLNIHSSLVSTIFSKSLLVIDSRRNIRPQSRDFGASPRLAHSLRFSFGIETLLYVRRSESPIPRQ